MKSSTRTENFYNRFSLFYPLADIFLKSQKHRLFREINDLPSGELLEIGVGNGKHLHLYKTHKITAIDTSSGMLKLARKHQKEDIDLMHMNGECLFFHSQTFDYVILSHVISVVNDPEKLLEEAYRVLKPGGKVFILNHFTPDNWLAYVDKSLRLVSGLFRFRSVFYMEDLHAIKEFRLLKDIRLGRFSYFKLLIYVKP